MTTDGGYAISSEIETLKFALYVANRSNQITASCS